MLVDLARNDVGRVVELRHRDGRRADDGRALQPHHAPHLPGVGCSWPPGKGPIDVLRATLPAGTLSGAPKVRAMEIIDELEPTKRGVYGGVVGYLDFSRQPRHGHRHPDHDGDARTAGPACRPAPASWPTATRPEENAECAHKAAALLSAVAMARAAGPGGGRRDRAGPRRPDGGYRRAARRRRGPGGATGDVPRRSSGPDAARLPAGPVQPGPRPLAVGDDAPSRSCSAPRARSTPACGSPGPARRPSSSTPTPAAGRTCPGPAASGSGCAPRSTSSRSDVGLPVGLRGPTAAAGGRTSAPGRRRVVGPAGRRGRAGPGSTCSARRRRTTRTRQRGCPPVPCGATTRPWEAARIEAGVPMGGREVTGSTIAAEAGLVDRTVSFTKGCFTGQELVARLDARGSNVARRCAASWWPDGARPPVGAAVWTADGGHEVGALSSVAWSAGRRRHGGPRHPAPAGRAARGGRACGGTAARPTVAEARPLPLGRRGLTVPADGADRATLPRRQVAAGRHRRRPPRTWGRRHDERRDDRGEAAGGPAGPWRWTPSASPRSTRDPETMRGQFEALAAGHACPRAATPRCVELTSPESNGMSSETLLVDGRLDRGRGRGRQRRLVARVEPPATDYPVFTTYDLDMQFRVMRLVAEHTDVPGARDPLVRAGPVGARRVVLRHGPGRRPGPARRAAVHVRRQLGVRRHPRPPGDPSRTRRSGPWPGSTRSGPTDHDLSFLELDQPGATALERSLNHWKALPRVGGAGPPVAAPRRLLRLADREPARPTPAPTPCPGVTAASAT